MQIVLAHPLTEAAGLGVAPAFVALAVAATAVAVAALVPAPAGTAPAGAAARGAVGGVGLRAVGVVVLVVAVAAGRLGPEGQFDNLAPALVIGLAWPLLLLLQATAGGVWQRLNPFDGLARVVGADGRGADARALAGLGVVAAGAWGWWLAGHIPGGLEPRAVGLGLGAYALVTLAGCLWAGREAWLSRVEVGTVVARAVDAARPWRPGVVDPVAWLPLAVLVGALAFAELRFSDWYAVDLPALGVGDPYAGPAVVAGFAVAVAIAVGSARAAIRWAVRLGGAAPVHAALPWLVVGLGLSAAVERDRLWTSAQLVVVRASDPLGTGLDLFGTASWGIRGWPLDDVARLWVQVAVLALAATAGLVAARRRGGGHQAAAALTAGWTVLAVLSAASL